MDETGRTAEPKEEKLNLGLSVKERMALFQKPQAVSQPKAEVGVAVRDRTRTLGTAAPQPVSVRKEPLPKPRPVETVVESCEVPVPRVSIKDRINMIESAAKATSVASPRGPVDFTKPVAPRNPFPSAFQPAQSPQSAPVPSFPSEQPKSDPFRPGRVAEMTSKISQSQAKASPKPLDIGVSLQEKKQLWQMSAAKAEPERVKTELEGLPSLEARKSLLSSKSGAEPRKEPVFVTGASLQDRLSALNRPAAGEDEVKRLPLEPMAESLAERKARIQQALAAKMGAGAAGAPIPIMTAGLPAFTPSTASNTAAVAPAEVDKPTIHRTVLRKAADFDDFD